MRVCVGIYRIESTQYVCLNTHKKYVSSKWVYAQLNGTTGMHACTNLAHEWYICVSRLFSKYFRVYFLIIF
mgnify:CR=1 FL=1